MNRILISFLFLLTITKAFPDTYTLYLIESKDSTILEETETDILSLLKTPGITIVSFIQTEGVTSPEDSGTVRTYAIPFTEQLGENGQPVRVGKKEIGTRFRVEEDEKTFSFSFSHTQLEGWIDYASNGLPVPIVSSISSSSQLTLPKGRGLLNGWLTREEVIDDCPPTKYHHGWIIVRGPPSEATIEIPNPFTATKNFQNAVMLSPGKNSDKTNAPLTRLELSPGSLSLNGEPLTLEDLPAKLQNLPKIQQIILATDASVTMKELRSLLQALKDLGFTDVVTIRTKTISKTTTIRPGDVFSREKSPATD